MGRHMLPAAHLVRNGLQPSWTAASCAKERQLHCNQLHLDMEQLLMEVVQGGLLPLGISVDCPSHMVCWRDSRVMQDSGEPAAVNDVCCAGCSRHCSGWLCWQCPCQHCSTCMPLFEKQCCRRSRASVPALLMPAELREAPLLLLTVKQHAMPLQAPTCLQT